MLFLVIMLILPAFPSWLSYAADNGDGGEGRRIPVHSLYYATYELQVNDWTARSMIHAAVLITL